MEEVGVSVRDVAAAAAVSVGTVSNVLNAPDKVAPATAERVLAAIDEPRLRPQRRRAAAAGRPEPQHRPGRPRHPQPVLHRHRPRRRGARGREGHDPARSAAARRTPTANGPTSTCSSSSGSAGLLSPVTDNLTGWNGCAATEFRSSWSTGSPRTAFSSVAVDDVVGGRLAVRHLSTWAAGGSPTSAARRDPPGARPAAAAPGKRSPRRPASSSRWSQPGADRAGGPRGGRVIRERPPRRPARRDLRRQRSARHRDPPGADAAGRPAGPRGHRADRLRRHRLRPSAVVPLSSIRQPTQSIGATAIDLLLAATEDGTHHTPKHVVFRPALITRSSTVRLSRSGGTPALSQQRGP